MSVRTIKESGQIAGYQALKGNGAAGATEFFSVAKYGDEARGMAEARSAWWQAARPKSIRPAMLGNRGGIPGLQLIYQASKREGDPPVLYAKATWSVAGKNVKRMYSTQVHGKAEAVAMSMAARERGAGVSIGRTVAEVVAILEVRL